MQSFSFFLATVSASEELPEMWGRFAFTAFIIGSLLACVVLVTSRVARRRSAWFLPTALAAIVFGLVGLAFAAHVYRMDYQPFEIDGTKASPPIWQALAIPAFPILASLASLAVYHRRLPRT